jgi:hypothetical protein
MAKSNTFSSLKAINTGKKEIRGLGKMLIIFLKKIASLFIDFKICNQIIFIKF